MPLLLTGSRRATHIVYAAEVLSCGQSVAKSRTEADRADSRGFWPVAHLANRVRDTSPWTLVEQRRQRLLIRGFTARVGDLLRARQARPQQSEPAHKGVRHNGSPAKLCARSVPSTRRGVFGVRGC
jgi:hypothetical protein